MARKKYHMSEARIRRWIQEGRGKGTGANYKPWYKVSDVPSLGRVHRPWGIKASRQHHFLSDNEYFAFHLFEWNDSIVDIREQFPLLDRGETVEIAARHGIKHPVDPQSGALWVLTTDFVLTVKTKDGVNLIARSVKQSESLNNRRTIEKLDIERLYWERREVDWKILTEQQLKNQFTANLAWIYDKEVLSADKENTVVDKMVYQEIPRIMSMEPIMPIKKVCRTIDRLHGYRQGDSLAALRRLLWQKKIHVDLNLSKIPDLPVHQFEVLKGAFKDENE